MVARRKKIVAETDNSNWKAPKKRRKPRKPMSEEQRVAAAARLEKAREKRKAKDPDYGMSGIHESLRNLPDVHPLHPNKVKEWIKSQKDLASSARSNARRKVKGALAQVGIHEGYLKNLQKYLRDGDWVDMFYGEHQQNKIKYRCTAQAYYWFGPKKGEPKFDVGTYYPLLGYVYTQEMFDEEEGISNVGSGERKRSTRTVAKDKKKSKTS